MTDTALRMTPMIQISGLCRTYHRGGESLRVLAGLDLEIPSGGMVSLMGPSGSGKSTLLNLIGALDRPDAGELIVAGQALNDMTSAELADWRAENVGFIFQGFNLIPVLSALENVELPLLLTPLSAKERRAHALNALELVGLVDRKKHRPSQLSGGQEQRVAIARAFVTDPKVILADEPTGDLDRASADAVLDLLVQLNEDLSKTILLVTHDPLVAGRTRRIVQLDKGKLQSDQVTEPAPG